MTSSWPTPSGRLPSPSKEMSVVVPLGHVTVDGTESRRVVPHRDVAQPFEGRFADQERWSGAPSAWSTCRRASPRPSHAPSRLQHLAVPLPRAPARQRRVADQPPRRRGCASRPMGRKRHADRPELAIGGVVGGWRTSHRVHAGRGVVDAPQWHRSPPPRGPLAFAASDTWSIVSGAVTHPSSDRVMFSAAIRSPYSKELFSVAPDGSDRRLVSHTAPSSEAAIGAAWGSVHRARPTPTRPPST